MHAIIGMRGVGKTSILKKLELNGFKVFSCDQWIHEQYSKNEGLKKEFIKLFGENIIENNKISRERLKKNISKDIKVMNIIMDITHPLIFNFLSANKFDFVEIPILEYSVLEFNNLFDKIFKIVREVEVQKFYKEIAIIKQSINYIKIKNDSIEESVKTILTHI